MLFFLYLRCACLGAVSEAVSPSRMVHGAGVPLPHSKFRIVELEEQGIIVQYKISLINYPIQLICACHTRLSLPPYYFRVLQRCLYE